MSHPNCGNHLHKQMSRRQLNIQNIERFHSSKTEKLFNKISKISTSKCVSFHLAGSNIYRTVPCDRPGKLDKVVKKTVPPWVEGKGKGEPGSFMMPLLPAPMPALLFFPVTAPCSTHPVYTRFILPPTGLWLCFHRVTQTSVLNSAMSSWKLKFQTHLTYPWHFAFRKLHSHSSLMH